MSHVYGPVPSRRLGRSLGVDLVPYKTCTYDCIYCQMGHTTRKTREREEWVPLDDLVREVKGKLPAEPDYITLAGSGEPTLYSRIGELIARIKEITEVPVAVLTNGSLLWDPLVRSAIIEADLVVPSLDAGEEGLFRYINRPLPDIPFDRMVEGLLRFRYDYSGLYWLEVFLLNASIPAGGIEKMAELARTINPDRVQLNTATRPPAEEYVKALPSNKMHEYVKMFGENAEVIADYRGVHQQKQFKSCRREIIDLLSRRPCTLEDIAEGIGVHRNEVVKYVTKMLEEGALSQKMIGDRKYFKCQ